MSESNKKLWINLLCLVVSCIGLYLVRIIFGEVVSTGVYGIIIFAVLIVVLVFVYRVSKYTMLLIEENKKNKDS